MKMEKVFSERYMDDAPHVAVASFYETSYLVSWNFEHLVKVRDKKISEVSQYIGGIQRN